MRKIEIAISDQIKLDAGTIEESQDHFLIRPPTVPMIEQLITQLDALPQCEGDFQIQHLGVAFTALCVRWGCYLSTLMDPAADLHPAIPGFHKKQPQEYGFISDSEMQRLNIEISYNVYHLVQVLRERENIGLTKLLWKAYAYLPMPHKRIPKNVREAKIIYAAVLAGMHTTWNSTQAEVTTGGNGSSSPNANTLHAPTQIVFWPMRSPVKRGVQPLSRTFTLDTNHRKACCPTSSVSRATPS
jgi:hypothetical protein